MEYGKIKVKIKPIKDLLMNQPCMEDFGIKPTVVRPRGQLIHDPNVEAERAAYIDVIKGKKQLYMPSEWFKGCILTSARNYQAKIEGKAKKQALRPILQGTISVEPEKIPLGHLNYEVFIKLVRVPPRTGPRVPRARPRIKDWRATFFIVYDRNEETIVRRDLKDVVEEAGRRVGVGDWRPDFGTFQVDSFEVVS